MLSKKNLFYPLFGTLLFCLSCGSSVKVADGEYLIRGELTNVADGSILELMLVEGHTLKSVEQDTVKDGSFEFQGKLPENSKMLWLRSSSEGFPTDGVHIWLESGAYVTIEGDGPIISSWSVESDVSAQGEETALVRATYPEALEYSALTVPENTIIPKIRATLASGSNDIGAYRKSLDSIFRLKAPLRDKITRKSIDHLRKAPVTDQWLYTFSRIAPMVRFSSDTAIVAKIHELYEMIPKVKLESELGEFIELNINPPRVVGVGDQMVDGELFDVEGRSRSLSEFKGRYILLDFWSVTCPPCHKARPEVERLEHKYADKMAVVAINIDPKKPWLDFVQKEGLKGNQFNELQLSTKLYKQYSASGAVPQFVLISPEGKVVESWAGFQDGMVVSHVEKYLK